MSRPTGKPRRQFTADEKAAILRRHLAEKVAVSDLCDEYHIQPSLFYVWQRQALDNLGAALQDGRSHPAEAITAQRDQTRIAQLEAKLVTKDAVIAEVSEEYLALKKNLGRAERPVGSPDLRDEVVDFVRAFSGRIERPVRWVLSRLRLAGAQYYRWVPRSGSVRTSAGPAPRDHWLEPAERQAIRDFHDRYPQEGYRRLTFMMLDADVVAVSPATVYRVLRAAGRLDRWVRPPSKKGTGFVQPLAPHEHWHTDVTYVNLAGSFPFLCGVLDGCSRYLLHWEFREQMREADIEVILQRAHERYPEARPRVITDTGPQFVARDFHEFLRQRGMTHVRTSPYYPQSNGKYERWNGTLKRTVIRPKAPDSPAAARRVIAEFVAYYNHQRLHSPLGYLTPAAGLAGRGPAIWAERDRKLEAARERPRARGREAGPKPIAQDAPGATISERARSTPLPEPAAAVY